MRILINSNSIESTFTSPTSVSANQEMTRLLLGHLTQCSVITADGFRTSGNLPRGFVHGRARPDERSITRHSGPTGRWHGNMLFTKDLAVDIESVISSQSCTQLISDRSTRRELSELQAQRARLLDDRKIATNSMNEIEFRLADATVSLPC